MTYIELQTLLSSADEARSSGNYELTEKLAHDVIAAIPSDLGEHSPSSKIEDEFAGSHRDEYEQAGGIKAIAALRIRALFMLSAISLGKKDTKVALRHAEDSLHCAEQFGLMEYRAKSHCTVGNVYSALHNSEEVVKHYSIAVFLFEELGNKQLAADCALVVGNKYWNLSDSARALEIYSKARGLYKETGDELGEALAIANIGNIYVQRSDYSKALELYETSLHARERIGDAHGVADIMSNIGSVYLSLSDYARALEYYSKALTQLRDLNDIRSVAFTMQNIGSVYANLSDFTTALEYYGKALAIDEELENTFGIASDALNMGNVYVELHDYATGLEFFSRALALDTEMGDKNSQAIATGNIGRVYAMEEFDGHDFDKAREYQLKALQLSEEIGDAYPRLHWLLGLGNLFANSNYSGYDYQMAEKYLLLAIDDSTSLGVKNISRDASNTLFGLYKHRELWKEALAMKEKHDNIKDEINVEDARQQGTQLEHRRKIEESERDRQIKLARFQEQEKILHNILPSSIANRMVAGEKTIAELFNDVSIFFSDIVGFTKLSEKISAEELVQTLNAVFSEMDALARKHGLEKIKTIGDAYMAVCGVPVPNERHAECVAAFAIDVNSSIEKFTTSCGDPINIRIGLHCGSVVAGIIGENKFAYDLWGDAVNVAARMESHGKSRKIHISDEFCCHLQNRMEMTGEDFGGMRFEEREEMEIKGKGMMRTYFLEKV